MAIVAVPLLNPGAEEPNTNDVVIPLWWNESAGSRYTTNDDPAIVRSGARIIRPYRTGSTVRINQTFTTASLGIDDAVVDTGLVTLDMTAFYAWGSSYAGNHGDSMELTALSAASAILLSTPKVVSPDVLGGITLNTFYEVAHTITLPSGTRSIRVGFGNVVGNFTYPRHRIDDVSASLDTTDAEAAMVVATLGIATQAHLQSLSVPANVKARSTFVHQEVLSTDATVPASTTTMFTQVLRSRQGSKVPVVMFIATGFDPAFPLPAALTNPN